MSRYAQQVASPGSRVASLQTPPKAASLRGAGGSSPCKIALWGVPGGHPPGKICAAGREGSTQSVGGGRPVTRDLLDAGNRARSRGSRVAGPLPPSALRATLANLLESACYRLCDPRRLSPTSLRSPGGELETDPAGIGHRRSVKKSRVAGRGSRVRWPQSSLRSPGGELDTERTDDGNQASAIGHRQEGRGSRVAGPLAPKFASLTGGRT